MKSVKEFLPQAASVYPRGSVTAGSVWKRLWPESGAVNSIPALDGLRAVAVLLVMLYHSWTFVPNAVPHGTSAAASPFYYGKTGVQLFFVLSGFLLFLPYAQWIFGLRSRPSTLKFYQRRALRVGPAYWVSLAILSLTLPITFASLRDVIYHVFYLSNVSWQTTFTINGVYWTMAIEVQFYVLLPLIAAAMYALSKVTRPIIAAAVVALCLVVISAISYSLGSLHSLSNIPVVSSFLLNYSAMPYWLGIFGFGIVASMAYVRLTRVARLTERMRQSVRRLSTGIGLAGILLALTLALASALHAIPLLDLTFGLAYACLLVGVILGARGFRRVFASRPLRFLGLISYSFYIWHRVVLHVIASHIRLGSFAPNMVAVFVVGAILSAGVAYVSYQALERPFIMARKQAHETSESTVPAALAATPA